MSQLQLQQLSNFSTSTKARSSTPPRADHGKTKAATPVGIFYRSLVPSMVACLAIASCVYYALELAYVVLEREKRGIELAKRVEVLEGTLEKLMVVKPQESNDVVETGKVEGDDGQRSRTQSWWKIW